MEATPTETENIKTYRCDHCGRDTSKLVQDPYGGTDVCMPCRRGLLIQLDLDTGVYSEVES